MSARKVQIVLHPRAGKNLTQLRHVLMVLSAAGWKTKLRLKMFGGQAQELARKATEKGCDLLLAYGGDGTLNQVINGVMQARKNNTVVGVIPGGTANVWASEVGIPGDPVKAALILLNSTPRQVDIGHVEVAELDPSYSPVDVHKQRQEEQKQRQHRMKKKSRARQHFLLMAGLGLDAAVLGQVSKPAKYRIGPLAVGMAAAKELPEQRPFPLEIWNTARANEDRLLWKGEARQVVIGNTRLYAKVFSMTPSAIIDDGLLDVCVITSGDLLTTLQQIASFLLHRNSEHITAEYFQGAHVSMRVPAWVPFQVDGSAVRLKDYLCSEDHAALQQANTAEAAWVTYDFGALPRALSVAIPACYDNTLFEERQESTEGQVQKQEQIKATKVEPTPSLDKETSTQHDQPAESGQETPLTQVERVLAQGWKVRIVGVCPHPTKKQVYIAAGTTAKRRTSADAPVAIIFHERASITNHAGETVPLAMLQRLPEGTELVVEGKKNKFGVITAKQVVV